MNRVDVLQQFLNQRPQATYVEIGVHKGKVFLKLQARRKIAIDPQFRISPVRRWLSMLSNPSNRASEYYEMTSDRFFSDHGGILDRGIDVAFVDGLHTRENAYRDVTNVLEYLTPNGVIVMHDCNPLSATAARYAHSTAEARSLGPIEEWDGIWNGDVFKAVLHLRSERDDLNVTVLDCDHGLGIVRRGQPDGMLSLTHEQIVHMSYEEFVANRSHFLNLRSPGEFLNECCRAA